MYSYGPPHMAKQKQDDQLELTYSSYVRIRDVTLKTCQKRWMIGRSDKRDSGISVLAARHDDDDDDDIYIYIYIYICMYVCVCVCACVCAIYILKDIKDSTFERLHYTKWVVNLFTKFFNSSVGKNILPDSTHHMYNDMHARIQAYLKIPVIYNEGILWRLSTVDAHIILEPAHVLICNPSNINSYLE